MCAIVCARIYTRMHACTYTCMYAPECAPNHTQTLTFFIHEQVLMYEVLQQFKGISRRRLTPRFSRITLTPCRASQRCTFRCCSLIDLMTATAQFGRVDIVIDDDVAIGENKQNTPALASRQHVHTRANIYTHIFLLYTSRIFFHALLQVSQHAHCC